MTATGQELILWSASEGPSGLAVFGFTWGLCYRCV